MAVKRSTQSLHTHGNCAFTDFVTLDKTNPMRRSYATCNTGANKNQSLDRIPLKHAKKLTVTISRMVGALLVILGYCGLFMSMPFGLHMSVLHSLLVLPAGVWLVYNWYTYSSNGSFYTCLGFGVFFALLGAAGLIFGDPGLIALETGSQAYDPSILDSIPGFMPLGRVDHVFHGLLSVILLLGAFDWHNTHLRELIDQKI